MALTPNPAQKLQADRLRFPGMLPREVLIFKNWLKDHEREYDRIEFNCRVGPGHDPGPNWPDNLRLMAIANSQKRIDACAWQGNIVTLIEVKDRAGAAALGQLLTYFPLWNKEHAGLPPAQLLMVTNRIQTGIDAATSYHGIKLDIVPTDFSILAHDRRASPFIARQRGGLVNL